MPKVEVEKGIELYYEDLGEGDKYILSLMMDFPPINTTRELAKHGYHVLLITNRGIGKSTHVWEDYGNEWFNIFADDVVRVADKLGIDKFIYAGCSHGAGTGWHLCLRHPERVTSFIDMVGGPHNIDEGTWSFRSRDTSGKPVTRKPMNPETDILGGISTRMCMWSGQASPSTRFTPFHLHRSERIFPISSLLPS